MDNRPIGVLDSGLGGLTVLKKVIKKLPNESTIFIGDQAHMPYGDRSEKEIIDLTMASVDFLLKKDVKLIIFGCNTATAVAMPVIQKKVPVQLIGVIQSGALAAARETKNKKVAVLGTTVTAESHAYQKEVKARDQEIEVKEYAEPLWAPLVETDPDENEKLAVVRKGIEEIKDQDFDTLILGCTHYPLLMDEIKANLDPSKQILDPADQVAQYTYNVLKRDNMLAQGKAEHEYFTTATDTNKFNKSAQKWMEDSSIQSKHVDD